jgi:PPP family 3-phenylpropionic acid transporter
MGASAGPSGTIRLRLIAGYIAIFAVPGIGLPFWPTWLESRQLSDLQIGFILALGPWVKLAGNPLFSLAADRLGNARPILIAAILASLGFYSLYTQADGFWPILAVTVLAAMCITAMVPLADGMALQLCAAHDLQYGRIRLWGSLAFIGASLAAGHILEGRSPDLVLYLMLGGLLLTLAVAAALPRPSRAAPSLPAGGWWVLLADRPLMLFLAAASLVQSSHAMLYSFSTLHWLDAGYGEADIGLIWTVSVVAEVLLFAAGAALVRRLGVLPLLVLGALAGLLRWTLAAFFVGWPALVAIALLHALTYAATHLAAMTYLVRHVTPGLAASAQGLYGVMAAGPLLGLSMLASGWLYGVAGGLGFLAMAVMCAGSAFIGFVFLRDRTP